MEPDTICDREQHIFPGKVTQMKFVDKFSSVLMASIVAGLALPGQAAEGQMRMRHPQVAEQEGRTVVSVELENPDVQPRLAEIWAEVYDGNGDYVNRFESHPVSLRPGQSARAVVVLRDLGLGKYRVIVAGRSYPKKDAATSGRASIRVEHVAPFTLSINRRKEIVLAQQAEAGRNSKPALANVNQTPVRETPKRTQPPKSAPSAGRLAATPAPSRQPVPETDYVSDQESQNYPDGAPPRTYRVRKGDWLSKIAKRFYGDAMKYPAIFNANREIIGDPDLIYPDQVFIIPEENMLTAGVPMPEKGAEAARGIGLPEPPAMPGSVCQTTDEGGRLFAFFDEDNLGAVSGEIIFDVIHERGENKNSPAAFLQQILRGKRIAYAAGVKTGSFVADKYGEGLALEQEANVNPLALVLPVSV